MDENDVVALHEALRQRALLERGPETRREAVKRLAEGFGFTVSDETGAALRQTAEELGIDFSRDTAATQQLVADMERDGLL